VAVAALAALLSLASRGEARGDASDAPVPIVLVHGICGDSVGTFGGLKALLEADLPGVHVHPFDYSSVLSTLPAAERASLPRVAGAFGAFVQRLGAARVDVIAHSMGGLIVRAWMAGQADDGPPYDNEVRRLITAGTPHVGVSRNVAREVLDFIAATGRCAERDSDVRHAQIDQVLFGSVFLARLDATGGATPGTPENVLTVVGCLTLACEDDLIVIAPSATLPPTSPDSSVAYILHAHPGLVAVNDRSHPFYDVALPFLREGAAGPGIVPQSLATLIVARVVTEHGEPYTRDELIRFGVPREVDELPGCTGAAFTRFQGEAPVDATGWWTLLGADPGCWSLFVDAHGLRSTRTHITAIPGRPVVSDPIVVRRKPLRR